MIYLFLLVFFLALAIKFDFKKSPGMGRTGKSASRWYNFALFVMIVFSGLRYKVGGDSISYLNFFSDIPYLRDLSKFNFAKAQFDPLWVIFSSVCKSIIDDFTFFQIIHAIVVNTIVYYFIKKNTANRFTCILIYYLIFYVYFNMEVMREALAICIFLLAYPYYKEGKWVKFYICALLAFLFHSSALILFVLPILKNIKIRTFTFFLLILIFVLITYIPDTFKLFLKLFIFNERISSRFNSYSIIKSNVNGMLYLFAIYFLFPAALAYFNEKKLGGKLQFKELYFAYFLIATITVGFSGFNRFLNYMTPFMAIYFADLLNKVYQNDYYLRTKKIIITVVIAIAFVPKLLYYFSDTSYIVQGTRRYDIWYPYYSVFNKQENYKRESLYEGLFISD
jgi:hypothetical protein